MADNLTSSTQKQNSNDETDAASAKRLEQINQVLDPELLKQRDNRIAYITEEHCIGCVKCIEACPFDAIIGAAKQMHVIIDDYCTGCQLCVDPCPVDCIDMIEPPKDHRSWQWHDENLMQQDVLRYNEQYQKHNSRIERIEKVREEKRRLKQQQIEKEKKQAYIKAAVERTKAKAGKNIN